MRTYCLGKLHLLLKDKEDCKHKAYKACEVIPAECFVLHNELNNNSKDGERNNLLDNLQLPDCEWSAIDLAADAVGRNHKAIFEECYQPTDEDNCHQADALESRFEHHLTIPRQGHK